MYPVRGLFRFLSQRRPDGLLSTKTYRDGAFRDAGGSPVEHLDVVLSYLLPLYRAGMREEVLSSNSMWYCLTCYLCTVRCPRGIKPTELMHALECLAVRHDLATRRTTTPIVYQSFVDILTRNGRVHEVDFIFRYYLNLYRLFLRMKPLAALKMVALAFMTPVALKLFGRGRLAFKAKRIKRRRELNAILNTARS